MPQQLIYTSAPRGVVAGRSGHCTVARSTEMREALVLQLEKLSYYQHLSLSGGQERPIYSCRVVDIRGSQYHVLTRIQDAGLDFTGRTNFLAHHLVFTPQEVRRLASPPAILRGWSGWLSSWSKEPQSLEHEDWSGLAGLSSTGFVPAKNWQQVTGDAANGYSLLEARGGIALRVDNLSEDLILTLFSESLELLELRDPRRDFHATAWQYTFTTSMQEQDNPSDFRWRCLHADNPASARFAGPGCRPLSDLRAQRVTEEETKLARSGRQAPHFVLQPQDVRATEDGTARLQARAEGVPSPLYQWFTLDRTGNGQPVSDGTGADLTVQNPPMGLSRYVVRASNSQGEVTSDVATLSMDPKPRLAQPIAGPGMRRLGNRDLGYAKSAEQIERQRRHLEAKQAEVAFHKRLWRRKLLAICSLVLALTGLSVLIVPKLLTHKQAGASLGSNQAVDSPATGAHVIGQVAEARAVTVTNADHPNNSEERAGPGTNTDRPGIIPRATDFDLPSGWMRVQIGDVSNPHADFTDPRYNLSAAAPGFGEQGDSVWFVCKTNSASTLRATLIQHEPYPMGSICGIMVRQATNQTAPFVFVGASRDHVISYRRNRRSQLTSSQVELPKWSWGKQVYLRIEKTGDWVVASYCLEVSKPWFPVGPTNEPLGAEVSLSGLAVCSGTISNRVVAKFGAVESL